ncbi:MAG: hypothetical protein M3P84_05715, partial [Chloroflexota bacterium]|nr:hypothetical protein [Chloroflexota bacterium]
MRTLPEDIAPAGRPIASGAAELLRSVGLMADGPTTWTIPVRSNRPGVYLVELPGAGATAPIDFNAVGRWLERVQSLRLDGARPTGRELAARLHAFWLADQSVLYIGTSGASIGSRIGAFQRTPLGDRKPYAGGYWLKTLTELGRLRVWWAETEAPEEYEDALLEAFAAGVPAEIAARLHDPAVVLPFANLKTAEGIRKKHGISGALLADDEASPATDAERRAAASRGGAVGGSDPTRRTGVLRSKTALRAAGSAVRAAPSSDSPPAPRRMS